MPATRFVRRPPTAVIDTVVVALLFAAASWSGARYVRSFAESGKQPMFYQSYFEPAVMAACGRGFVVAAQPAPAVTAFLELRSDTLDCAAIPDRVTPAPGRPFQDAWFYLMWLVALAWKLLGISWSGLGPLFGVLFGTTVALVYGIVRTALPPIVAAGPAAWLVVSPLHLQVLPHLRDYAKAPFVLALAWIVIWMVVRPRSTRALWAGAAAYGAIAGIGYGFRTDLLAAIPMLVIAVVLFLPGRLWADLPARLGALALAACVFVVVAWPVVSFVASRGGCQWHVSLLGLDDRFMRELQVRPASYRWHAGFSDEFVYTSVRAAHERTTSGADFAYCTAEYDEASRRYFMGILAAAPADVLTRAYASVLRVMDLPFYWWNAPIDGVHAGQSSVRGKVLRQLAGAARLAVIAAVLVLGAIELRLGAFAAFFVLYFGSYPSLQFASRHVFHLEFIGLWAMALIGWWFVRVCLRTGTPVVAPPHAVRRGLLFAVVLLACVLLPVWPARAYQETHMKSLVADLATAPRVPVPFTVDADGVLLRVVPEARGREGRTDSDYLDARLDAAACPHAVLNARYESVRSWLDFTGPLTLAAEPTPSRVLFPVYAGFAGLYVSGGPPSCLVELTRIERVEGRPLLPVVAIPDGGEPRWRQSFAPTVWTWPFAALWRDAS